MYDERPSAKRIVTTLASLGVGLVIVFGIIFAISYAIAPKTPPTSAPVSSAESSAAVSPTLTTAAVLPTTAVVPVPQPTVVSPPTIPATSTPAPQTNPLSHKVIVIDAGHQAKADSALEPDGPGSSTKKAKVAGGATGYKTHNPESLINLYVALKLRDVLVARGATVIMVRTTQNVNIANSKRAKIANDAHANLFIRLHCDGSADHKVSGITTLVPNSTGSMTDALVIESRRAGRTIQQAVVAATGAKDRGVTNRGDLSGFNWATVPSIVVEMGFMSNAAEDVRLGTASYQRTLANGLANGIAQYLGAQ